MCHQKLVLQLFFFFTLEMTIAVIIACFYCGITSFKKCQNLQCQLSNEDDLQTKAVFSEFFLIFVFQAEMIGSILLVYCEITDLRKRDIKVKNCSTNQDDLKLKSVIKICFLRIFFVRFTFAVRI